MTAELSRSSITLSDEEKKALLQNVRTIAVVGLSPRPNRPSHRVAKALQQFSYRTIPVRPAIETVLGEKAYSSLVDIPFDVDLVNVFRAPEHIPLIVEQCIQRQFPVLWLQEGIIHEQAASDAINAGISVVMNECIHKELIRLGLTNSNVE